MTVYEPSSDISPEPAGNAAPESTARLGDIWLIEDGIYGKHLQVVPADEVDPEELMARQRSWSQRMVRAAYVAGQDRLRTLPPQWRRSLRSAFILALLSVSAVATITAGIVVATRIGSAIHPSVPASAADRDANPSGVVIVPQGQDSAPTPAAADYQIGVWPAVSNPSAGGVVQVFVRLTHQGQPLANASVSLDVTIRGFTRTYGPTATDSYGLASFFVSLGGASSNRPVYLNASYLVGNNEYALSSVVIVPE